MATQVCSLASFEGLEAARRCQHTLEQEILNNRARIEVVKKVNRRTISVSLQINQWMDALKKNVQTEHLCRSGLLISELTSHLRQLYSPKALGWIYSSLIILSPLPQEGHGLVRAQHPGSTKIEEFLGQLEVLWEELRKRHQRNAVFLQASEELGFRVKQILNV